MKLNMIALNEIKEREVPLTIVDRKKVQYLDLVKSIQKYGVIQPISVMNTDAGWYILITGLQRVNACMDLGLDTIPALIHDFMSPEQLAEMQLMCSACCVPTTPVQYTRALLKIMGNNPGMTLADMMFKICNDSDWILKTLNIKNKLCPEGIDLLKSSKMCLSNGYMLAKLGHQKPHLTAAQSMNPISFVSKISALLRKSK